MTAAFAAAPTLAETPPKPLFASDDPIRVTITGPIGAIARAAENSTTPREATLAIGGTSETYPIRLSARGISRRTKVTCQFPPLRVDFTGRPAETSLFAGQRRLKLVTHCRSNAAFQQHTLLEYSGYRILNLLDPLSFRARLALVTYLEADGRPVTQRIGFFLEDKNDVASRNGYYPANVGDRISFAQLDPRRAARIAMFQYMIGDLDWAMIAGPRGEGCCHNVRLLTAAPDRLPYHPITYDFDYSGLVDASYAVPPEGFHISSVRNRVYRGYCRHNGDALAVAAEFRAKRHQIEAIFGQIPQMEQRTRAKAVAYLARFFDEIATDDSVRSKILNHCVG
ncbi:MAG: hypothetical protein H0W65_07890 [Sphingomonas sp.]|uniref:hypothetical protein n=1 Tax=Sphingomonas sp. TaxID=28214 RepID=UPI0017EE0DEE|nr:hypothetical protein [Sphingomonas sp.]MBA3667628.1 hypothetical protein [Sphingomonas sp.]